MASLPTLEQQCFLHILQHLEKFPVESLSLLPVRVRHRLLLSAPVADVYQLEQTSFVKDINMDEVWRTLCKERLILIPSILELQTVFGDEMPPRELITTAIAFQFLHSQYCYVFFRNSTGRSCHVYDACKEHKRCEFLFSSIVAQDSKPQCIASLPQQILIPPRYTSLSTDKARKHIVEFLATTCRALPTSVFIDCSNFNSKISGAILEELMKKVQHIWLSCDIAYSGSGPPRVETIRSVLKPLLRHSSTLQHISLGNCTDKRINEFTQQIIQVLNSKQTREHRHTVSKLEISVTPNGKSCALTKKCGRCWMRLKKMGLKVMSLQELEANSLEASRNLGVMITNFSSLHTLKLEKWWTMLSEHAHQDHMNLLDILCSFLMQPHFQCLVLGDTCLPLVYVQRLVHTFLLSPCSQPQTLRLEKLLLQPRHLFSVKQELPSLPLTEWGVRDPQTFGHPIVSIAEKEYKNLAIINYIPVYERDEYGMHVYTFDQQEGLAILEAARSWLTDLSRFELKSLSVQGDPHIACLCEKCRDDLLWSL